jgi:hypothetical protein
MNELAPLAVVVVMAFSIGAARKPSDPTKVDLTLRVNPAMAFSPARIILTAQLRGGTGVNEDLYCPTVEWDWGDGTVSQSSADCEPFQPNKSEIQRSYITTHVYKTGGEYTVKLLLQKAEKVVTTATASLNISRAIDEGGEIIR